MFSVIRTKVQLNAKRLRVGRHLETVDVGFSVSCPDLILEAFTRCNEDISYILSSLGHKKRLQLLTTLLEGPNTFGALKETTRLGKTALAHHLGILVKAGVLNRLGKGRYELSEDGVELLTAVGAAYARSKRRRELRATRRADYIRKVHTKQKDPNMKTLEVNIVKLEPMKVASVRAVSKTPERDAWEKMHRWAESKGLLENIEKHPVFGFNNPDPSPDRKEYGYEFWIQVGQDIMPNGEVEIQEFEGGLYAVTTCKLKEELESEFFQTKGYLESWKKIVDWVNASKYRFGKHKCLEKAHDPGAPDEELVLDLYCPIEE